MGLAGENRPGTWSITLAQRNFSDVSKISRKTSPRKGGIGRKVKKALHLARIIAQEVDSKQIVIDEAFVRLSAKLLERPEVRPRLLGNRTFRAAMRNLKLTQEIAHLAN